MGGAPSCEDMFVVQRDRPRPPQCDLCTATEWARLQLLRPRCPAWRGGATGLRAGGTQGWGRGTQVVNVATDNLPQRPEHSGRHGNVRDATRGLPGRAAPMSTHRSTRPAYPARAVRIAASTHGPHPLPRMARGSPTVGSSAKKTRAPGLQSNHERSLDTTVMQSALARAPYHTRRRTQNTRCRESACQCL